MLSLWLYEWVKRITYTRDAEKTLRRLPANASSLIVAKIEQYARDPASLANNVKQLRGDDRYFRQRVGDWRVIFSEDGVVVAVIRIAARGSVCE